MKKKNILFVVAHPDDEILAVSGTIARLIKEKSNVYVLYLFEGSSARFDNIDKEKFKIKALIYKRKKMAIKASKFLKFIIIDFLDYPNLRFKNSRHAIIDITKKIEVILNKLNITEVFTHHPNDMNCDHEVTYEATVNACRPKKNIANKIFLFEVPSSTDWSYDTSVKIFYPNTFVNVEKFINTKLKCLEFYKSELRALGHPRSILNIKALSIYRGGQSGFKYAEAFQMIRFFKS